METFYYFKDKYVLDLLLLFIGEEGKSIEEIENSNFSKLLKEKIIEKEIKNKSSISRNNLLELWSNKYEIYKIHFEEGKVFDTLTLLFSNKHNKWYGKNIGLYGKQNPFWNSWPQYEESSEELELSNSHLYNYEESIFISSMNSNLIADVESIKKYKRYYSQSKIDFSSEQINKLNEYIEIFLKNYIETWSEATLSKLIDLGINKYNIKKFYFPSQEVIEKQCLWIKNKIDIKYTYKILPEKFCFNLVEIPSFILNHKNFHFNRSKTKKIYLLEF